MLLTLNKILIYFFVSILFVACTNKYYVSPYYKNSNHYKKIKNQKIKKSKAMQKATMRSYVVHGKRYYPTKTYIGEHFNGVASWYGPDFHAKLTSNGERYNMYAQTAASKTLPMNTMVKVYNKDNGKSTIVRINDRGPFVRGRIIDLSNKAAHDIDMVKKGTANIELTIIGFDGIVDKKNSDKKKYGINGRYYIQVGAFSKLTRARNIKRKFNLILEHKYKAIIKQVWVKDKRVNKVLISSFRSKDEANNYKEKNNIKNSIIVTY